MIIITLSAHAIIPAAVQLFCLSLQPMKKGASRRPETPPLVWV